MERYKYYKIMLFNLFGGATEPDQTNLNHLTELFQEILRSNLLSHIYDELKNYNITKKPTTKEDLTTIRNELISILEEKFPPGKNDISGESENSPEVNEFLYKWRYLIYNKLVGLFGI